MLSKSIGLPLAIVVVIVAVALVGFTVLRASDDAEPDVPADVQAPTPAPSADGNAGTDAGEDDQTPSGLLGPDRDLPIDLEAESFIGLSRDEAAARADSEGRIWRIGREDDEWLPVTDDYRVGRVTFELESDQVVAATIEQPFEEDTAPPGTPLDVEDENVAAILAAATTQLLTVDHSFGVGAPPPFSDVRVATVAGGTGGTPLAPLTIEMIAAAVTDTGASLEFTDDPQAMIADLFDTATPGVAVLTVGTLHLDGARAEVEMQLWCGSLCGVYLTYEAVETDDAWTIIGPIGPIAMS